MIDTIGFVVCLLWVGTAFLSWFGTLYYLIRTSLETRPDNPLMDFLLGGISIFQSSKLTEKGLRMRGRLMLCVLGFLLSWLLLVATIAVLGFLQ